jgi:hypothetical protein
MNIQVTSTELLSQYQKKCLARRKRISTEFQEMKQKYETQGEFPSVQLLCRVLGKKYDKNPFTIRRYLQAEKVI